MTMSWLSRFFPRTVASFQSPFNRDIKIIEKNTRTSLVVNGVEQSGEYVDTLFRRAFTRLSAGHPGSVNRIAVIGIGGGIAIRKLRDLYPKAHITGVDIDPVVVDAAKKYFHLGSVSNCSLLIWDAEKYVRKPVTSSSRFDLVIVDIYIGNDVPGFVTQKPFLSGIKKHMRPGGFLIINYFSFYQQPEKTKIFFHTLSGIFDSVKSENILRNKIYYCS